MTKTAIRPWLLTLALALGFMFLWSGCKGLRPQGKGYQEHDGNQYGVTRGLFLGRWWDFYERGRSFADGGFWQEAEDDLSQALRVRTQDDRRARTYGAHFVQYFANRELGVVLFRQAEVLYEEGKELLRNGRKKESDHKFEEGHEKIKSAIQYLKSSIIKDELSDDEILTEKAQYYLKLCYRQFAKIASDNQAPVIHLDQPPASMTNEDQVKLSGWVEEDNYVDILSINGKSVKLKYDAGRFHFATTIILSVGKNGIVLEASDASGNASRKVDFSIFLDVDPPVISIIDATPEKVTLSVVNERIALLKKDRIENVDILQEVNGNIFHFAPIDPAKPLYVEFIDEAKNRNGIRIQPEDLVLGDYKFRYKPERDDFGSTILLASSELPKGLLSGSKVASQKMLLADALTRSRKLEPIDSLTGPDESINRLKQRPGEGNSPPEIVIQELDDLKHVYQEYLIISGRIKGEFRNFKINDQIKIKEGKDVRFSFKERLELGRANKIQLGVSDAKGIRCESCLESFEITRHPSPEEIRDFRAATVIYPPSKDGGDREITQELIWDLMVELKRNGRFRISARDKDIHQAVNKEQKLRDEGWIDSATAARFGKILNAEYSIACLIRPTQDDVEIYARLIDVESKETLASCDVYEYSEDAKDFENAYFRFVQELGQNFPVVGDEIEHPFDGSAWGNLMGNLAIFSKQGEFRLEMGRDANIKEGMKFVAYDRDDPLVDVETGEILVKGKVQKVGELFAKTVTQKVAHLEPITRRMKMGNARYVISK